MDKKTKIIEVLTVDGKPIISFQIVEKEMEKPVNNLPDKTTDGNGGKNQKANHQDNEPLMTDAQKRYLFRILANQGIEGDAAYSDLTKRFEVNSLKEVTKIEASQEIERMLAEQKQRKSNDAPQQAGGEPW